MERANAAELVKVTTEVAVAQTELATAQRVVKPAAVTAPARAHALNVDAIWARVVADQEHRKTEALSRIRGANAPWVAARLARSQRHLRVALARFTIDRHAKPSYLKLR